VAFASAAAFAAAALPLVPSEPLSATRPRRPG
jgi:hypothetical protein